MSLVQWSLLAQLFAAVLTCLVLALFVGYSRRLNIDDQQGWMTISIGFALLLFGMLVELARSHPDLSQWLGSGSSLPSLLFDILFGGQLLGVLFLAYGFSHWMPAIRRLREAEASLQRSREELEHRVLERTNELAEANQLIIEESERLERLSRELSESQRRMATLFGNLPGMAYRGQIDAERSMEFVSEGCVELTGYPPEQLVAGDLIRYGELIDERDRERVNGTVRQALDRGDRFHLEYRPQNALGRTRQVWEQGTGVYDDAGDLQSIEGLVVDITQRKRVEDRLQLASLIIDNALEGIMVTDEKGVIEMVNPSFTTITGFGFDEVVGHKPSLLKSGRHDQLFYQRIWEDVNRHGFWRGEIWNQRKNGEIYPEWLTINAIRDQGGSNRRLIGIFTDITQRKLNEEHLKHLAHHDVLTALPNRLLFLDRLQQQIRSADRERRELAVLFLDLDKFKPINDQYGHNVGDLVLKEVALRLTECVRSADTVARIGGDEFTVIVGALESPGDASVVAEKILASFAIPFHIEDHQFVLGVSIGIALYPHHGKDAESLTHSADVAMYSCKSEAGHAVRIYEPEMGS